MIANIFLASSSDLTIHTYGGGEILQKVFVAIAMLSGKEGVVGPLMFLCASIGIGFAACKMLSNLAFDQFFTQSFIPLLFIYSAFSIPTTTIHIQDELQGPKIYKVDHVPRLLAYFAEITSSIGYYITTGVETAMHTVDDVKYSKTGLIFGADTALDFKRFQLTNPDLQKDLKEFSKQCVLYDLALGRYSLDELKKSTDLWGFLKERTSKLGMIHYCPPTSGNGESKGQCQYLNCQEALGKFQPLFDNEKAYYAKQEIGKNLPLTFQALTHIKQESQQLISQQLMINVLSDQFSGGQFAQERAYAQQRTTYQAAGCLAGKGIVIFRSVFEAVIYASFLFVLPLSLLPSGIKIIVNWVSSVIWIQFWPPFYAVLNYIASIVAASTTGAVQEGVAQQGLSIFSNLGLQNFASDTSALAGYLTLSVPYLTYIILQGGLNQFVQLAGTLTSPTQSAASSASIEQTSGNYSYDNISVGQTSYGNTTAFQTSMAPTVSDGYFLENKGSETTTYATQGVFYDERVSNLTSSINADQVFGESLQHQRQHAQSNAETTSKQYQESISEAVNTGSSLIQHMAQAENFNEGTSSREAYDAQQAVRHMESAADNLGRSVGLSSKQMIDFAIAGSLGGNIGFEKAFGPFLRLGENSFLKLGFNASVSGSGAYSVGADESKAISAAMNFANSEEFTTGFQKVKDYATTSAFSSSMDEGVRMGHDFSASLSSVNSSQESYQAAKTHLDQVSDTSAWYEQNSHLIKENLNQKYMDWAIDKFNNEYQDGTGFDRFKAVMNSSDPADVYQSKSLMYEFVQNEINKQSGISNPAHYRDPNEAYSSLNPTKLDWETAQNEYQKVYDDRRDLFAERNGKDYKHQKYELEDAYKDAKETHDSFAYFTDSGIQYQKQATQNQFDIENQRMLLKRAWGGPSSKEKTSNDYQVEIPPFFQRGDE